MTAALAVLAAFSGLGVGGCGGDDEPADDTAQRPPADTKTSTRERTAAPDRTQATETEAQTDTEAAQPTSPEEEPGGAGDEEAARSQALFTGRGGSIAPRRVRVPPFIAIRVELRSADRGTYALRFGRKLVRAGGQIAAASTTFPGLRPGRALVGRQIGGRAVRIRIEASAEPGP